MIVVDIEDENAGAAAITAPTLAGVDAVIDFTNPQAAVENMRAVLALGGRMVVGTTGWYQHLDAIKAIAQRLAPRGFDTPAFTAQQQGKKRMLTPVEHMAESLGALNKAFADAHLDTRPPPKQKAIEVTAVVTIATDRFAFAMPVSGLMSIPHAGTLLARDGDNEVRTPFDDCVLVMPSSNRPLRGGVTVVRLGRLV